MVKIHARSVNMVKCFAALTKTALEADVALSPVQREHFRARFPRLIERRLYCINGAGERCEELPNRPAGRQCAFKIVRALAISAARKKCLAVYFNTVRPCPRFEGRVAAG